MKEKLGCAKHAFSPSNFCSMTRIMKNNFDFDICASHFITMEQNCNNNQNSIATITTLCRNYRLANNSYVTEFVRFLFLQTSFDETLEKFIFN